MSKAEVAALFAGCKSLQVATIGPQGEPHLTTLWFAIAQGQVLFETYGKSQKVVNLRRDPRIAVLCEAGETYDQLRGVSIQGQAEIVEAGEHVVELMTLLVQRNHPELGAERAAEQAIVMAQKRVVVVVHPEKTISWDHRKLA